MKTLNLKESQALLRSLITHLDAKAKKSPTDIKFTELLDQFTTLLEELQTDTPTVGQITSRLYPDSKPSSARVTFAKFRTRLRDAAESLGHDFSLIKPDQRGREVEDILCYFEGRALIPDREKSTRTATEKLDEREMKSPRVVPDVLRVFVSFAIKDETKAQLLVDCLEKCWGNDRSHQVTFWKFNRPHKDGLLVGDDNLKEIENRIAGCPFGLFLLSPDFMGSSFIQEHELSAYFPQIPAKYPLLVNLRNSRPPASHLSKEMHDHFIFSHDEKSFDQMRGLGKREEFAMALCDELELLCQRHFPHSSDIQENTPAPKPVQIRKLPTGFPEREQDAAEKAKPRADTNTGKGMDAVGDLLSWANDIERGHYLALLGEVGAGKTTTALMFARKLNQSEGAVRAYLFDLRYANYDGLLKRTQNRPTLEQVMAAILKRSSEKEHEVSHYLEAVRTERAVLIFDGLDELFITLKPDEQDALVHELLKALPLETTRHGEGAGKLLLACRTHYFRSEKAERGGFTLQGREGIEFSGETTRRTNFELSRLLPFTEEQIKYYFEANIPDIPFGNIWETLSAIHNLRELATRPYLLNLIRGQLPRLNQRVEKNETVRTIDLYDGFIEDWSHERNKFHNLISAEDKNSLMELLALHLWQQDKKTLAADELEGWLLDSLIAKPRWQVLYADQLKAGQHEALLSDFRTASFVSRWDGNLFRFAHTSIQEYFLARILADSLKNGHAREAWNLPMPSQECFAFLGEILTRWKEHDPTSFSAALSHLEDLTGDSSLNERVRLAALEYTLRASQNDLPFPKSIPLDLSGCELAGRKFYAHPDRPVTISEANFEGADLIRASFEHLIFEQGANWSQTDLRSGEFIECDLQTSSFAGPKGTREGLFFRNCRPSDFDPHKQCPDDSILNWKPPSELVSKKVQLLEAQKNLGHSLFVNSASFSPDGRQILSGASDNSVKLLDTASRRILRNFEGHSAGITSVSFSHDGHQILSGSYDNSMKLWDAASGKLLRSFDGHSKAINSVSFSPNGRQVLSGSSDNSVKLWDAASGKLLRSFEGHSQGVTSVSFSPNGYHVLSGSRDHSMKLWDADSGKLLRSLKHTDVVTSLSFSPDGRQILSGSWDSTVKLWDTASGEPLSILEGHSDIVNSVSFSPDGRQALAASFDKSVKLWNVASGKLIHTFEGHSSHVSSASFSPNGRQILSGAEDYSVKLWDIASGKLLHSIEGQLNCITSVSFSPDGRQVLSGSWDSLMKLWDTASGKLLRSFEHTKGVTLVSFSPDGKEVSGQNFVGDFKCWTLEGYASNRSSDIQKKWHFLNAKENQLESVNNSSIQIHEQGRLAREIVPLPEGQSLVLEPWDETEALKPAVECRWKLVRGPRNAWRYVHAIDRKTGEIFPPEYLTEAGTWEFTD